MNRVWDISWGLIMILLGLAFQAILVPLFATPIWASIGLESTAAITLVNIFVFLVFNLLTFWEFRRLKDPGLLFLVPRGIWLIRFSRECYLEEASEPGGFEVLSSGTIPDEDEHMPDPTILPPNSGGNFWIVGDQICFKLTGEQTGGRFAFAENYISPQHGPPPHVHHLEHECFYVLEGTFMFGLGDATMVRGPGTAVFLPKDIPHVFRNVGDTPGRFLLIAQPAGFEKMVATCGQSIASIPCDKQVAPEEIQKLLALCPQFGLEILPNWKPARELPPAAPDRRLWVLGQRITLKLGSADTQGEVSVAEIESFSDAAVPIHAHVEQDEIFFTLDGTWEFNIAGLRHTVPPRTFIHVPKGVMHGFRNVGGVPAKMVDYHLPGGFEKFFEEAGTPAGEETTAPILPPPDPAKLKALLEKHGMVVP